MALLVDRMLFPVRNVEFARGRSAPADARQVWLEPSPGVRVEGWFFPGKAPDGTPIENGPAVLFFHGNGDLIDWHPETARIHTGEGVSVLLAGFRGYGRSTGNPALRHIPADAVAWFDLLASRPEVDPNRIVVHGYSLGAAFAAQVAGQRPVSGIILEAPFRSLVHMARRSGVLIYLAPERLDTERILSHFTGPVLILHGRSDPVIPYSHGAALAARAPNATLITFEGDHILVDDWERYRSLIADFRRSVLARND